MDLDDDARQPDDLTAPWSLRLQDEEQLGGRASVLTRQKRDHVTLDRLLHDLGAAADSRQDAVLRQVCRLVFPHAFAEESVLWPVMRRLLPDGDALTCQVEVEHQEVNELVTRMEQHPAGTPTRHQLVSRLVDVLREDVRDEEDVLLPRLQAQLTPRQLRILGITWEIVRRTAPTRAHPVVARRPPGNVVAALPLSVIDRARDRIDLLQERRVAPRATAAMSRGLTRLAHRTESLPLMRRGESPSTRSSL
jgi:hypothetical protein